MSESKALTQFSNSMAVMDSNFDKALEVAVPEDAIVSQYLRVHQERSNTPGLIAFGMDQTPVDPDSEWALNTFNLQHGWILRDGGKVLDRGLAPIFQPRPSGPAGSKLAFGGSLKCVTEHHSGVQVEFSGDADYHKKFFGRCIDAIRQQRVDNPGTKNVIPVLRLEVKPYPNAKDTGQVYPMIPHVMYWLSAGGDEPEAGVTGHNPGQRVRELSPAERVRHVFVDAEDAKLNPVDSVDTARARRVNVSEEL